MQIVSENCTKGSLPRGRNCKPRSQQGMVHISHPFLGHLWEMWQFGRALDKYACHGRSSLCLRRTRSFQVQRLVKQEKNTAWIWARKLAKVAFFVLLEWVPHSMDLGSEHGIVASIVLLELVPRSMDLGGEHGRVAFTVLLELVPHSMDLGGEHGTVASIVSLELVLEFPPPSPPCLYPGFVRLFEQKHFPAADSFQSKAL